MRLPTWPAVAVLGALLASGCDKPVDLTQALQVQDVSTGWWDAGVENGQNKLVPSVTFTVKNVSDQSLKVLQVNVLFRRVTEKDTEWGSGLVTIAGSEGLAPGATSQPFTVTSKLGYTGTEPRQQMLANSHFVDATAQLFAKYGSTQWTRIDEHPVARTLLAK
jgi:hypothetical protein